MAEYTDHAAFRAKKTYNQSRNPATSNYNRGHRDAAGALATKNKDVKALQGRSIAANQDAIDSIDSRKRVKTGSAEEAFTLGFMDKCAALGVDPEELLAKQAEPFPRSIVQLMNSMLGRPRTYRLMESLAKNRVTRGPLSRYKDHLSRDADILGARYRISKAPIGSKQWDDSYRATDDVQRLRLALWD